MKRPPMDSYLVKLELMRDMLATNPCDPKILDTHVIGRARKLITENEAMKGKVDKYLAMNPISDERSVEEQEAVLDGLEEITGWKFEPEDRERAIKEGLDGLRETFKELDLKGTTIFLYNKELMRPMIGDHMIYGFLKSAVEALCKVKKKEKGKAMGSVAATHALINQHIRCTKQFLTFDRDLKRDDDGEPFFYQRSLRIKGGASGPRVCLAKSEVIEAGAKLEFELRVLEGSQLNLAILEELFAYGQVVGLGQWRNASWGMFEAEVTKV